MKALAGAAALTLASAIGLTAGVAIANNGSTRGDASSVRLNSEFDHIGAEVRELDTGGRTSYYIDEGPRDGRPVVYIGGQGTSLEAFQLTEFARSNREALGLRVISVERNGFGESEFDGALGYADYTNEVLAVLQHLDIDQFVIVAISGGGAYAAQLAAAVPGRVISLHAAAAVSSTLPTRSEPNCTRTTDEWNDILRFFSENPKAWWGVPGSPVLVVPGWQTRAYADATRTFYVGGQLGDPSALTHEYQLPCSTDAVVDAGLLTMPVFLYYGGADTTVPTSVMEQWQAAVPNVRKAAVYPDQGHTVQYRHWDQILADMAGYHDDTVMCRNGRTRLVPDDKVDRRLSKGATLGSCAWTDAGQ